MELLIVARNVFAEEGDCHDHEGHRHPPIISLQGYLDTTKVLDVTPSRGARASEWAALAAACECGTRCEIDWGSEAGEVCISVRGEEKVVTFTTFACGGAGEGKTEFAVKASCCADAFRLAACLTEEWLGARVSSEPDAHDGTLGPAGLDSRIPQSWCGTEFA